MKRELNRSLIWPVAGLCCGMVLVVSGLRALSEQTRTESYYLGGIVLSMDEDVLVLQPEPEQSSLRIAVTEEPVRLSLQEVSGEIVPADPGESVRVYCDGEMEMLFGIYPLSMAQPG